MAAGASPMAIIIGGANGAGKTTFARALFSVTHPKPVFLNADEVAREGYEPLAAGRETLRRLRGAVEQRRSFVLESTLSSKGYARQVPSWQMAGFTVVLHFLEVPSANFAVERVAGRVAAGGHDVPEPDIRRRYDRGLELLDSVYKSAVDAWTHWQVREDGLEFEARSGS